MVSTATAMVINIKDKARQIASTCPTTASYNHLRQSAAQLNKLAITARGLAVDSRPRGCDTATPAAQAASDETGGWATWVREQQVIKRAMDIIKQRKELGAPNAKKEMVQK